MVCDPSSPAEEQAGQEIPILLRPILRARAQSRAFLPNSCPASDGAQDEPRPSGAGTKCRRVWNTCRRRMPRGLQATTPSKLYAILSIMGSPQRNEINATTDHQLEIPARPLHFHIRRE